MMDKSKKKGAENWSPEEKEILCQLIAQSARIIEDKSTKTAANLQKNKEWKNIASNSALLVQENILRNKVEDETAPSSPSPAAVQRARAERNRQKARALRAERAAAGGSGGRAAPDAGGGFLPAEADPAPRAPTAQPPAPRLDPTERPPCEQCARPISLSYLLDTFRYPVCDDCRDAEGAHSLVTRTEAKAEFLLQECDLDGGRGSPLPCVRRRNPHAARGDMRLYLRAQVEARALAVWGSAAAFDAEAARREAARARLRTRREERRLRALRMDARPDLFRAPRAAHAHHFGPETYDARTDLYTRACDCGHTHVYEKM